MSLFHSPRMVQVEVQSDRDVVTIRQDVRQQARTLGLGLAEQAKLAAAVGGVARALLALKGTAVFTIRTTGQGDRQALEVVCSAASCGWLLDLATAELELDVPAARMLVDETELTTVADRLLLTLRVVLAHHPRM
ncbi:MAG TPA: hypothetical protein VFS21_22940 [Roseiflexaceae bacterium]|nr:hypothetical protein [Roseiflexaceae bacterium]